MRLRFHCPILPDEHILSWLTRIHFLLGYSTINCTLRALKIKKGVFRNYQYNHTIRDAINFYRSEVVDDTSCFDFHTTFPLWALKNEIEYYSNWREQNSALIETGFLKGRLSCGMKWKYCPACLESDENEHGHTIWSVKHQLPSVTHCITHKVPLIGRNVYTNDLMGSTLPAPIGADDEKIDDHKELYEWSKFINDIYEVIRSDPIIGSKLTKEVRDILSIPENLQMNSNKNLNFLRELHREYESDMPVAINRHLFRLSDNNKQTVNIFKATFGYRDERHKENQAHPVYWLAIMYWMKDKIDLNSFS